ncbi:protein-tyrosine sulfotransferase isoform X1 [Cephus cinctus]|uniref:Protein-tyrosine sulfotransferase n=1 Tax=Cephus cinctus TaxID=211228 RepID=A0AAJ7W1Q4_CEPCN|nr:protein-tyrosine sulfotransferase isoform X1 [Cephus cinctus]XP_024941167.1 protein-tyrosine sulfotransferase isoform X1 [Cephus cinctus]XP_024941173.1 protein-tyrosine sulfotransferase isoform X1 [Cephus cinctus]XP_024941183.1 protein-tyrosine sulfotransferase isoform X1 [Cephus cinctus]XP_024941191.1 protein-tyrosine sulfotransferase isoform X1 [Cephus cinctus]
MSLLSSRGGRRGPILCFLALLFVFGLYQLGLICGPSKDGPTSMMIAKEIQDKPANGSWFPYDFFQLPKYVVSSLDHKKYSYDRTMPLIFIGGVPRSGTTLMRAMLDAHPDVRCGQETRVIPRILQMRSHWLKSERESVRLVEAGISKEVMDSAIAAFCLEVIARHGEPAPRLCNKDPLTLKMGSYVLELFPNAKFLFMVRDGRATVHSIISRKVTITGFDLTSYRQCLTKWNHAISVMHSQCKEVGSDKCLMVPYEQLVLHPREWMKKILSFLDVPWNESVLHHEEFINKPGGVPLSKVERSSDQVIKPVNLEALTKWVGHIPDDVVRDMPDIAPMLSVLGYDPYSNPPVYGAPDSLVSDNTRRVLADGEIWAAKARQLSLQRVASMPNEEDPSDSPNA